MSLFLPVRTRGSAAIAVCQRCAKKMYYADLKRDPNNHNWYCADCVDGLDPYKLPPKQVEDMALNHPRVDEVLTDG
jgi:NAD-dependent SIR2 family protein deacetylase